MFKLFSKEGEMHGYVTFISVCGYTSYYRYVDLAAGFNTVWDEVYTEALLDVCKGAVIYV